MPPSANITLGVCGNAIAKRDGVWHTHHSFGRIVELLAARVNNLKYFAPQAPPSSADWCDYPLAQKNISVSAWPVRRNSMQAMKRPWLLLNQYAEMVQSCDALFVRGSQPLLWRAHQYAHKQDKRLLHWIVGNPVSILRGERRGYGSIMQAFGLAFARFEQRMTQRAIAKHGSFALTNGEELARLFASPRTIEVISTSITQEDFLVREDTCTGKRIRLLFVGFVRPEKGLVHLIRALPLIKCDKPIDLAVVGSTDQFAHERQRLETIAEEVGVTDRISWEGYARFGGELFSQFDRSDILVLPSLSEGTPRVLIEARARSLPIVATNVGGIPSSVQDGVTGLLVPPADPGALAVAISRIISEETMRRSLITAGRECVADKTVDRFVELVLNLLTLPRAELADLIQRNTR